MAKTPQPPRNEAEKRQRARDRRRKAKERMGSPFAANSDAYPPQNFFIDQQPLLVNGVDTGT